MTMTRLAIAAGVLALVLTTSARAQEQSSSPPEPAPPATVPSAPAPMPPATAAPALPTPLPGPSQSASPTPGPSQSAPPVPGLSQSGSPVPGSSDARYKIYRVQESFMRLDTQTGQVSLCGHNPAGWSCQALPDDRTALESEIGRLQSENAALKSELLARGLTLPGGPNTEPPLARAPERTPDKPPAAKSPNAKPDLNLPSDAELDRVVAFMGKVWKRMVETMAELQRDIGRKN